jgi:hypothetical protein
MTWKRVKVVVFNHSFSPLALIRLLRLKAARSRIDDGIPRSRKAPDLGHPPVGNFADKATLKDVQLNVDGTILGRSWSFQVLL